MSCGGGRPRGPASCTTTRTGRRLPAFVADTVRADDLVITMGAGDVTAIGPELLALLADSGADSTEGG